MRKIDHVLEKKALLDYKYIDTGIFSKGLTYDARISKNENVIFVCFWTKIGL